MNEVEWYRFKVWLGGTLKHFLKLSLCLKVKIGYPKTDKQAGFFRFMPFYGSW